MYKRLNNKVQSCINFTAGTAVTILVIGLVGSYELDRVNTIQFVTKLLVSLSGCCVIHNLLTYINCIITSKLFQANEHKILNTNNKSLNKTA